MSLDPPSSPWLSTVVFRTVRDIEKAEGALDDGDAVRRAATQARTSERRLAIRAWLLGERLGLPDEIERWRGWLPWLLLGAAIVVGWLASGILSLVTGQDRSINAIGALAAVLVLPTVSLLIWCVGLLWRRPLAGGGLTRWVLAAAARFPGLRTPHSVRLFRSALDILGQARLVPWTVGLANHVVWIGAFIGILLGLLVSFSFRAYTLSWETTILRSEFFAGFVAASGWLPAAMGFPVPDAATAQMVHGSTGDQRPWAWWLIGCAVVYGLLPRLVAAVICWLVWQRRKSKLPLIDTGDDYTRNLLGRFARWDQAASGVDAGVVPAGALAAPLSRTVAAVGFELPAEAVWPLTAMTIDQGWTVRIEGTAEERRETLDRIAQTRPRRVLLICWANATPDRGTARFLRGAVPGPSRGALLLVGHGPATRWQTWLVTTQLDGLVALFTEASLAQSWLQEDADA